MKIANAYTQTGNRNGYFTPPLGKSGDTSFNEIIKNSGDKVCFSDQAMELLNHPDKRLNACPQDATYDHNGNMNRQLAALQRDLSGLASSSWPVHIAMMPQINSLQSQVSRLCMQV